MKPSEFTITKLNLNNTISKISFVKFSSEFNYGFEKLLTENAREHDFKGCSASAALILNALCSLAEQAYKDFDPKRRFGKDGSDEQVISTDDLWDRPLIVSVPRLAALIYPEGAGSTTSRNNVLSNLHKLCSVEDPDGRPLFLKAHFTKGHDCVLRLEKGALDLYFGVKNFCFLPCELFNLSALGAQVKISYQQRLALYAVFEEGRARLVKDGGADINNCQELLFSAGTKIFAVAKTVYNKLKRILKALVSAQLICEITVSSGKAFSFNFSLLSCISSAAQRFARAYKDKVERNEQRQKRFQGKAQKGLGRAQVPKLPQAQMPRYQVL